MNPLLSLICNGGVPRRAIGHNYRVQEAERPEDVHGLPPAPWWQFFFTLNQPKNIKKYFHFLFTCLNMLVRTKEKKMGKRKFYYNEKAYENGLDLSISVQFIYGGDCIMNILSCTVSDGTKATDYGMVAGETTLEEVVREFLGQ
jgi:hypothetical protein